MDFQYDKNTLRSLLLQGDLLHAINGGAIAPMVNISNTNNRFILRIKAPSVAADSFEIIQNNNTLLVYALYKTERNGETRSQPLFTQNFIIPPEADLEQIEAFYRDGELTVVLPMTVNVVAQRTRKIKIKNFDRQ